MIAVILCGGLGTRIGEETVSRPKPLIEIGGRPILWHIMKTYSHYGINEFVICCGYKGNMIKEYFSHYFLYMSDVTFDMRNNEMKVHTKFAEPWRVTLVDTGNDTMTGGRLKRVAEYVREGPFCFTYGDGVSDVDISALVDFHRAHGRCATVTAVQRPERFGILDIDSRNKVIEFREKPVMDAGFISGGFFVLEPGALDLIGGDETVWEEEPMRQLVSAGQLSAYCHKGFWHPMDTLRDKIRLEGLWDSGRAPWKVW